MPTNKEDLRKRLTTTKEKSILFNEEDAATLEELSEELGTFTVYSSDIAVNKRGKQQVQVEVRFD